MVKIKLIIIGHSDRVVNFNTVRESKSKFFKFSGIEHINNLPNSQKYDGYLDIKYSQNEIKQMLKDVNFDGLCIAIMNYRFDDNFYMHRAGENKACISIFGLESILNMKNISIENFILKNIYELFVFYPLFKSLPDEVYNFVHSDTRGCLFDLNGDKRDVIYNTEKPVICDECQSKINKKSIPKNFIEDVQKELLKIDKPFIKKIEVFIRKYPLFSILATFIFSTVINLFSSWVWEFMSGK